MKFKSVFVVVVILNLCLSSQNCMAQVTYNEGRVLLYDFIATSYNEAVFINLKKAHRCLVRVEKCEEEEFWDEIEGNLSKAERQERKAIRALKKYKTLMEKAKQMSEKSIIYIQKSIDGIQMVDSVDSLDCSLPEKSHRHHR